MAHFMLLFFYVWLLCLVFMMVKFVNRLRRQEEVAPAEEILLLCEISEKLGNTHITK